MTVAIGRRAAAEHDPRDYRPSITADDLASIQSGRWAEDPRRVTIGRIFSVDLPAALRRWARGFTKDERETLRTEALLWIVDKREGKLPLRREWAPEGRLSGEAWSELHTALNVAKHRSEVTRARKVAETETPTEPVALGVMAEREDPDAPAGALPDLEPELLAELMGTTLAAARAITYRAYGLGPDDAADQWSVARSSVSSIVDRGRADLARSYPDPADLLRALDHAWSAAQARAADHAGQAMRALKAGRVSEEDAEQAAAEYLSTTLRAAPRRQALTNAIRRAWRRRGIEPSEETITRHARSIERIITQEAKRARQWARTSRNPLPGRSA